MSARVQLKPISTSALLVKRRRRKYSEELVTMIGSPPKKLLGLSLGLLLLLITCRWSTWVFLKNVNSAIDRQPKVEEIVVTPRGYCKKS